jgi:transposase-like protein
MARTTRAFSAERQQRIEELCRQGLTADTIADMLQINPMTVYRAKRRAGMCTPRRDASEDVKLRAKQLLHDGCSYQEVARTIGFDASSVVRWFPGFQFTPRQAGHAAVLARQARRLERLTLVEKV